MKAFFLSLFSLLITLVSQGQTTSDSQIYLADPAILYSKGTYYLYGTVEGSAGNGFKVYSSTNQKDWLDKGYALKKGDVYGDKGFWAPQVFSHLNKFYMAYVANENIAIAKADSPIGPFIQENKTELKASVKQIDPYIFFDDDGKIYLYHVRLQKGNRLFVAQMKSDLSETIPETLKECLHAENGWENTAKSDWPVAEGPTVIKRNGVYYLFYTANDFRNPDYAVGFATSDSPLGPWKKYASNPILDKEDVGQNGTGHGDFYKDEKGGLNYVFHTHNSPTAVGKRKTAIVKAKFAKDNGSHEKPVIDFKSFQFLTTKKQQ
ncbi:glycoside hydrolase family 43 protein [Dyadobacter sp. CY312]|uniref:glycoside hydrolase family 43 protein n=1 Tax=Dyadobacter sp. CY312 TaxID=2907303 RepID=UPI001F3DF1A6|nr:glycoside hydrolase family 43 protein [Dyadobacter sp. CY312]MCE7041627.1 glycoside hydrolase family 43 protein [Dyadobacter sp. CY312]